METGTSELSPIVRLSTITLRCEARSAEPRGRRPATVRRIPGRASFAGSPFGLAASGMTEMDGHVKSSRYFVTASLAFFSTSFGVA